MTRRSRPSVVLAAVTGLLAVSALAVSAPAIAATPGPAAPRTVPRPAGVRLWPWRVSGRAAYNRALRSGNWAYTPEGLAPRSCVHRVPRGGHVIGDGKFIVSKSGARTRVTPCPRATIAYPASSHVRSTALGPARSSPARPRSASPGTNTAAASCQAENPNYWAYTCSVDANSLTHLSERFSIPADPTDDGAVIFFWPGFQTSDQTSIVQPVLTWGANAATGVTNPNIWYLTSWYGDDGTYYTSSSAHVQPDTTVTGTIGRLLCDGINTACTWDITTADGSASVGLQWFSGPGMNVLDGGVMEVPQAHGCIEVPATGHEAFRNLLVNDTNGGYTPSWQRYTTSGHCSVNATFGGLNTDITWAPVT